MSSTSPYQQNDYQAANAFRPYSLPVNDIFNAISAQNKFWDEGAQRVKSVYDNALGLDLSIQGNKDIRDQFMKQADQQITKLSSMNLSDPSIQRQGFNIFQPLFQDQGVMSDHAATSHISQVMQDANSYKSRDNGKLYSDDNLQYALQGANEFKNSTDRMAGLKYMQTAKDYEPYYDYTDDFTKAMKGCNPSSVTTQSPEYSNGQLTGYSNITTDKALSATQVDQCLNSGMSPKGLRQLQIEGWVKYNGHPEVLASDASSYLSGLNNTDSHQLQELSVTRKSIADKTGNYAGLTDDQQKSMLNALDQQTDQLTDRLDKNSGLVKRLNGKDYSVFNDNYDAYAGSVYTYRTLFAKSQALQYEQKENKQVADPVQMMAFKFKHDNDLAELNHNYAKDIESMKEDGKMNEDMFKYMMKGSNGQWMLRPDIQWQTTNLTGAPDNTPDPTAYSALQSKVSDFNNMLSTANTKVFNNLIRRADRDPSLKATLLGGFNYLNGNKYGNDDQAWSSFKNGGNKFALANGSTGDITQTSWFKAYSDQNPDDDDVREWKVNTAYANIGAQEMKTRLDLVDKEVIKSINPKAASIGDLTSSGISNISPVNIDGKTITPQMVSDALGGKSNNGLETKPVWTPSYSEIPGSELGHYENKVFYNSQQVPDDAFEGSLNFNDNQKSLFSMIRNVNGKVGDVSSQISQKRAELLSNLGFSRDRYALTPDDKSPFVQSIRDILPTVKSISVQSTNFSGGVNVNIPGADQTMVDKLNTQLGLGTGAKLIGDGVVHLDNTNYMVIPQAINNPIMKSVAYQLSTVANTADYINTPVGQSVKSAQLSIPMLIAGKTRNVTIEVVNDGPNPEYNLYIDGANTSKPQITATSAYDLLNQFSSLPTKFR